MKFIKIPFLLDLPLAGPVIHSKIFNNTIIFMVITFNLNNGCENDVLVCYLTSVGHETYKHDFAWLKFGISN